MSAHRIDVALAGKHRNLGPRSGVARNAHKLHHAIIDFRDFAAKQGGHIVPVRTRNHDLRAASFLAHIDNQRLQPSPRL